MYGVRLGSTYPHRQNTPYHVSDFVRDVATTSTIDHDIGGNVRVVVGSCDTMLDT